MQTNTGKKYLIEVIVNVFDGTFKKLQHDVFTNQSLEANCADNLQVVQDLIVVGCNRNGDFMIFRRQIMGLLVFEQGSSFFDPDYAFLDIAIVERGLPFAKLNTV